MKNGLEKFVMDFPFFWNFYKQLEEMDIDLYFSYRTGEWFISDKFDHQMMIKFVYDGDDNLPNVPREIGVALIFWTPEDYDMQIDVGCGITASTFVSLIEVLRNCKRRWSVRNLCKIPKNVNE